MNQTRGIFFLLFFLLCPFAFVRAQDGERQPEALYNAVPVPATGIPIAYLLIYYEGFGVECTGIVIGNDTILTAAHCLQHGQVKLISVVAGGNEIASAVRYGIHGGFVPLSGTASAINDMGYIKLDRKLSKQVSIAKVSSANPKYGDTLLVYGYGRDESGTHGILKFGTMKVLSANSQIVRAVSAGGGANPCHGDSGGPAFILKKKKLQLVGIASTADKDCSVAATYTALQSRTAKGFLDFAKKKPKGTE